MTLPQSSVPLELLSICVWGIASVLFANLRKLELQFGHIGFMRLHISSIIKKFEPRSKGVEGFWALKL